MQPTKTPSQQHDLERFVKAQASSFEQARAELAAGRKQSHWMWFIFPQVRGLGRSSMAQRFAITGLPEAVAYLEHPVLGPRLHGCTLLVNQTLGRSAGDIFGYPDDLKFHSSMTLFSAAVLQAAPRLTYSGMVFSEALALHFGAVPDKATLDRLR